MREPVLLCTLLGSCVGITFWVKRLRIGALCHPMLPAAPARPMVHACGPEGRRFVDFAIRDVAAQFDALGITRVETEVKVFGGADVLELDHGAARRTIGYLNREAAVCTLRDAGYSMAASSLGGRRGMQIHFNTQTGEVLLRRFGRMRNPSYPHRHHPPDTKAWK